MVKKRGRQPDPVTTGPIDPSILRPGNETTEFDLEIGESLIHEKLAPIVEQYFPADPADVDVQGGAEIHIEHESEHSDVGVASRKKRVPPERMTVLPYEKYVEWQQQLQREYYRLKGTTGNEKRQRLLLSKIDRPMIGREEWEEKQKKRLVIIQERHEQCERRRNDDVARAGEGWYVICDGVTQRGRNISALMGEAIALATEEVAERLRAYDPPLNERTVKFMMRGIVERARRGLVLALRESEMFQEQMQGDDPINPRNDLATTVEAVIHLPQMEKAFVLHIGDSRTYAVPLVGPPRLITEPHVIHDAQKGREIISSVASPAIASAQRIDVHAVDLQFGDRLVSVSDGAFAGYEWLLRRGSAFGPYDREAARYVELAADSAQAADNLVTVGLQTQDLAQIWDDCSAAVLESVYEKYKY